MVKNRGRGEKLPKNYVKIAILHFVRDKKKSRSEIRDYLKKNLGVSEPRGVRSHLSKLCQDEYLEGNVKPGIGSYYQWKKTVESFKKIIEFISTNSDIAKKIIIEKSQVSQPLKTEGNLQPKKLFEIFDVDSIEFWYNTKYAKSFFTEEIVNNLLKESFEDYSKNKGTYSLNKLEFRTVVLENIDTRSIVILMHYSPNLVRYIIDLPNLYKNKTRNLKEKDSRIFFTIFDDIINKNYNYHGGGGFIGEPNINKIDSKAFKGVKLEFGCSLMAPGTSFTEMLKGVNN